MISPAAELERLLTTVAEDEYTLPDQRVAAWAAVPAAQLIGSDSVVTPDG
jgi:hypothetical protein